jgi:lysozyme family protein
MDNNFKEALKQVLVHEGGWSDHPEDPGGATMKGVTLTTFRRHFGQAMSKEDLRNITDEQLGQIYRAGYWDKCHCDELPAGVDYAVFDAAVNSGPGRSAKWLQAAVGATQDGAIGQKTLARVEEENPIQITNELCDCRLSFLQSLSTWPTFGRGWGRRVEEVRSTAINMADGENQPSVEYETVRIGSKGPWVRKLQQALQIQVDGDFGHNTHEALVNWQKAQGLEPDGIAGRNTYRALGLVA